MSPGDEPTPSERRLVENEQIMEALNERLGERVQEIREESGTDPEAPIRFFCECSDITCRGRISLEPARYDQIHRDAALFVILPGHENASIETVVDTWGDHVIVRKSVLT